MSNVQVKSFTAVISKARIRHLLGRHVCPVSLSPSRPRVPLPILAGGGGPGVVYGVGQASRRGGPGVVYGAGPASHRGSPSWGRLARPQQRVQLLHSRQEHGDVLHPPRAPWADVPRPPPWVELTSSLWGAGTARCLHSEVPGFHVRDGGSRLGAPSPRSAPAADLASVGGFLTPSFCFPAGVAHGEDRVLLCHPAACSHQREPVGLCFRVLRSITTSVIRWPGPAHRARRARPSRSPPQGLVTAGAV